VDAEAFPGHGGRAWKRFLALPELLSALPFPQSSRLAMGSWFRGRSGIGMYRRRAMVRLADLGTAVHNSRTMLFNTWTFLCFGVIVFALYYVLPFRWQNRMLLAASYIFYGAWDWRFLSLVFVTTAIDYTVGLRLEQARSPAGRKRWVAVSCVTNLGLLAVFKYLGFFAESFANLAALFGWNVDAVTLHIILPVGISFYTFQSLSYTIDVYRGNLKAVRSLEDFALFVCFFPQLVAGPIERATHLVPQLTKPRTLRRKLIVEGSWLILWGLFKKAVIADNIAPRVDEVFFPGNDWASGGACLLGVYGFAIQIYCDFSGYSDIARGLGRLMGIEIIRNFDLPYLAKNPPEFWRKWHISLSFWFRDYLFLPLAYVFSRQTARETILGIKTQLWVYAGASLTTMLLCGLWHGAAWTYVLWGLYHGALMVGHRWLVVDLAMPARIRGVLGWRGAEAVREGPGFVKLPGRFLSWLVMFHLICFSWIIFRAGSIGQVGRLLRRIAADPRLDLAEVHILWPILFFGGVLGVLEYWLRNADDPRARPGWNRGLGPVAVTAIVVLSLLFWPPHARQFIYFQF
jgi:D-alanyl-lipoteichoic acid acyltransferase DltB (MBOAT superfamily)